MDGLSFDRNFVALCEVTVNNNRPARDVSGQPVCERRQVSCSGPNYSDLYWPTQPTSQTHECTGWLWLDVLPRSLTVFARNGCALKMKLAMHGPSPRAQ